MGWWRQMPAPGRAITRFLTAVPRRSPSAPEPRGLGCSLRGGRVSSSPAPWADSGPTPPGRRGPTACTQGEPCPGLTLGEAEARGCPQWGEVSGLSVLPEAASPPRPCGRRSERGGGAGAREEESRGVLKPLPAAESQPPSLGCVLRSLARSLPPA